MEIQGQLSDRYKGDRYLKDRLQEACDIHAIQDFLKDLPDSSSQQLINRVANRLSEYPRSAGFVYANWAIHD